MNTPKSLTHTKWECKYHIVWIPKYRRKTIYKELSQYLGSLLKELKFHRFFSSPNLIRPGYPSSWHEKWIFTFCAKLSRENIKIQFIKQ